MPANGQIETVFKEKLVMLRATLRSIVRFLFFLLTHLKVEGLENIPSHGSAILASNHVSILDSPLIFVILERQDATALVGEKYQENPVFRWLVNAVHGIWINRQQADIRALKTAIDYLQNGGLLGIAPEGTRSHTGALTPAKEGVAYLVDKAGVEVIPVAITGTENVFHALSHFQRARIKIRIGQPFRLPPMQRRDRSGSMKRNTDEIMCHIAALLPAEYRGIYADHPLLQELLEKQTSPDILTAYQPQV